MDKRLIAGVFLLVAAGLIFAVTVPVNPSKGHAVVSIPDHAVQVAPGVFDLGYAMHEGKLVKGFAFVDYKKGFGKPGTQCGNGVCEPGENAKKCPADCGGATPTPTVSPTPTPLPSPTCYGFLANGAKWKTVEPYLVNPQNTAGLDEGFVFLNLFDDIAKWEAAAGTDILGNPFVSNETLEADFYSPDGLNEVYFGDVADNGAIAITVVWGIFSGPPSQRKLIEWDQVYDQVDYPWSASGEAGKMDFENIATHELGHSIGLNDLYTGECSEQTMYGYADYGETNKRTLEAGDITGVQQLYG
ncbi:MAG: matrixin family metalloprotease [Candidatus Micrarchaeota archaeon]